MALLGTEGADIASRRVITPEPRSKTEEESDVDECNQQDRYQGGD